MLRKIIFLISAVLCSTVCAGTVELTQLKENTFSEKAFGLEFVLPPGWKILKTNNTSAGHRNIYFKTESSALSPTLYYRTLTSDEVASLSHVSPETWLRQEAAVKEDSRRQIRTAYTNRKDSFKYVSKNEIATLTWLADYKKSDAPFVEYFARILHNDKTVMLFVDIPADKVEEVSPELTKLLDSLTVK